MSDLNNHWTHFFVRFKQPLDSFLMIFPICHLEKMFYNITTSCTCTCIVYYSLVIKNGFLTSVNIYWVRLYKVYYLVLEHFPLKLTMEEVVLLKFYRVYFGFCDVLLEHVFLHLTTLYIHKIICLDVLFLILYVSTK